MKSAVLLNALRWCSTAKHFALSRRRSRVQIPVGAMILVRSLISKRNKCEPAKKKPKMKLISEQVERISNLFSIDALRANLNFDMSILSIKFDTTGFCSPVFSLHLFLSMTSEIIGGLSMSSLSCSKKSE